MRSSRAKIAQTESYLRHIAEHQASWGTTSSVLIIIHTCRVTLDILSKIDDIIIPVKIPWIFPGAPLKINGAPGNIQGNLAGMILPSIFKKIVTDTPRHPACDGQKWGCLLWVQNHWLLTTNVDLCLFTAALSLYHQIIKVSYYRYTRNRRLTPEMT